MPNYMSTIVNNLSKKVIGYDVNHPDAETRAIPFSSTVEKILTDCGINNYPVSMTKICSHYGIKLIEMDLSSDKRLLGDTENDYLFGFASAKSDVVASQNSNIDPVVIAVNNKDSLDKQYLVSSDRMRFTAAHDFAHIVLHLKRQLEEQKGESVIICRRRFNSNTEKEIDADEFAAQLLMPKEMLETAYNNLFIKSVYKLAEMFAVSPRNMKIRLDKIGISDYLDDSYVVAN